MQVPERLALIGGSILLASTLIFTLKSQASSIIPNVSHSISGVFNHIGDAQKASDFDNNFQNAQKNGWTTGQWGSSKYYIDNNLNMYVGKGNLQGKLYDLLGNSMVHSLKTINIEQPVIAPQDSTQLFSGSNTLLYSNENNSIQSINGLDNVDTSNVTNMKGIFSNNRVTENLNGLSNWDTSHVIDLSYAFDVNIKLRNLDVKDWNVNNVEYSNDAFGSNLSLTKLDLNNWTLSKVQDMSYMFNIESSLEELNIPNLDTSNAVNKWSMLARDASTTSDSLSKLQIGSKTNLIDSQLPKSVWKQGNTTINYDQFGFNHPGIWIKQ